MSHLIGHRRHFNLRANRLHGFHSPVHRQSNDIGDTFREIVSYHHSLNTPRKMYALVTLSYK